MKGSHLKAGKSDTRTRIWSFLLYPESMPENWDTVLRSWLVPVAVSPLHNKDTYDDDGEGHKKGDLKKPHYHCVAWFDVKTSFKSVCELLEPLNAPIPQKCRSLSSAVRYFVHKDDLNKAQYRIEDIKSFNGFDVEKPFALKSSDYPKAMNEIMNLVRDNELTEYYQVMDMVLDVHPEYLIPFLKYSFSVDKYLASKRFKGVKNGN